MASTGHAFDPAAFYSWQPASGALTVHLSLDVVRRLHQARGPEDTTARPRDLAGVLLGHSVRGPQPVSMVEDFLVLSDVVSPTSEQSFMRRLRELAEAAGVAGSTVGCFRWQTGGRLSLTEKDREAANQYFNSPGDIVLLIRSRRLQRPAAAYFWSESGSIASREAGFEFPFDADLLAGRRLTDKSGSTSQEPTSIESGIPVNGSGYEHQNKSEWLRLSPTIVLAMIATGVSLAVFDSGRKGSAPSAAAVPPVSYESPLGLEVTPMDGQLHVHWNRKARSITSAVKGMLKVSDGGHTRTAEFDAEQLKDGYAAYAPTTNNVDIRLEVQGQDGNTISESVQFFTPP